MILKVTEEDEKFINEVGSSAVERAALILIVKTLQTDEVGNMTDEQCRARLATCQAYVAMLNFSDLVMGASIDPIKEKKAEDEEYLTDHYDED